jgi:glyoxylase-like metal-dependent hydrolase (beta-lactamase superfamily II)
MRFLLGTVTFLLISISCTKEEHYPYIVTATEVAPNIYMMHHDLGGMEVNSVVMKGEDGNLFVDTGSHANMSSFGAALRSIDATSPDIIINTHAHTDHTGGNLAFGNKPLIIGHAVIRERLRADNYRLLEYPEHSLPSITFTEPISLHYNGEEIKIIPFPGAHDNNDAFVYFTKSKVVYTADNFYGVMFLTTDAQGNALNYAEAVAKIIEVVPDDAVVIPGHGRQSTMDEVKAYHKMLVETRALVKETYDKGIDLATMQSDSILKSYESYNGMYVDATGWIGVLFNALAPDQEGGPQDFSYTLYQAIRNNGVEAGKVAFVNARENEADKWATSAFSIYNVTGNYLMPKKHYEDAITLSEFGLEQYPDWAFNWAFYELIGEAHMRLGHNAEAIRAYELLLEEDSTYAHAARLITDLK